MHYIESGDSQSTPVVFIHGMGTGPSAWQPQLDGLSGDFYMLAPFLPGYGAARGPFSFKAARERLNQLIEQKINAPVHLCGLSLGALVALDFARSYPEKIHSLVLSAGFVKLTEGAREQQRQSANYVRTFDPDTFAEEVLPQMTHDVPLASKPRALGEIASLTPSTLADLFELNFDASSWVEEINIPALVLCGSEDKANLELSQTLAEQLPQATFDLIPNAGHIANLDAPTVFAEKLKHFVMSTE